MMRKLATWADVKAKGEAILETGGVEIVREDSKEVEAYVMSGQVEGEFPVADGGPYHVILSKRSWENRKNVGGWCQGWLCDCTWGSYFSGEPGRNGHDFGWYGRVCFEPDSMVLMADGSFKPICDIEVGDIVQSKSGPRKVVNVFENDYDGEMIELGFSGSCFSIRMTADHNVLCNDAVERWLECHPAESINNNRSVGYRLLRDIGEWRGFKQAKDFVEGDLALFGAVNDVIDTDVIDFVDEFGDNIYEEDGKVYWVWDKPDEWNGGRWRTLSPISRRITFDDRLAYVLGWYLAEGSIEGSINKRTGKRANTIVRWTLNKNEVDVAEKIISILESWGCEGASINDYSYRGSIAVKVSSRPLAELFIRLCGEKSKCKRLERRIMLAQPMWQSVFLDAYYSGDGTKKGHGRCVSTANHYLARQINQIVQRVYGVDASVHMSTNTQGPTYRSGCSKEERESSGLTAYCIDFGGDYVQRRYAIDGFHTAHKVNSIKTYHKKGKVWNIEVEDEHIYCVEGLLVHNCSHVYALLLAANLRARKDFFGDRTARVSRAEHIEDRSDCGFDWGIYRLSDGRYAASVKNIEDNELIGRIPMPRGSKESLIATMTRKLSKVAQKRSGSHNDMEHVRKVIDMKSAARPAYNGYRWGVPYSVYRCDPNAPWIGMELDAAVEMGMKPSEYNKVYDGFLPLKGEPSTDSYLDESIMWSIHSDDNAVDVGDCVQIDNNFYYITACNGYNYKYERIPSRMFDPYLMERRASNIVDVIRWARDAYEDYEFVSSMVFKDDHCEVWIDGSDDCISIDYPVDADADAKCRAIKNTLELYGVRVGGDWQDYEPSSRWNKKRAYDENAIKRHFEHEVRFWKPEEMTDEKLQRCLEFLDELDFAADMADWSEIVWREKGDNARVRKIIQDEIERRKTTTGKISSTKESTRKFTYAEMKELEDEVEDKPWLNNADRLKDPDILGSFL